MLRHLQACLVSQDACFARAHPTTPPPHGQVLVMRTSWRGLGLAKTQCLRVSLSWSCKHSHPNTAPYMTTERRGRRETRQMKTGVGQVDKGCPARRRPLAPSRRAGKRHITRAAMRGITRRGMRQIVWAASAVLALVHICLRPTPPFSWPYSTFGW